MGKHKSRLFLSLIVVFVLFTAMSCKREIVVAYHSNMTGKGSELSHAGKAGFMLAVSEQNNSNKPVKIKPIILDDQNSTETAIENIKRVNKSNNKNLQFIIGHSLSEMTKSTLDYINKNKILMISPTSSSDYFENRDDYFIKCYPSTVELAKTTIDYAILKEKVNRFVFIGDNKNQEYVDSFYRGVRESVDINLQSTGKNGSVKIEFNPDMIKSIRFRDSDPYNLEKIISGLVESDDGLRGIILATNPTDSILMASFIKKYRLMSRVILTAWATTGDLLVSSGELVEGAICALPFKFNCTYDKYSKFTKQHLLEYGRVPSFAAVFTNEAANILFEAFNNGHRTPDAVKNYIIDKGVFNGLQSESIVFNKYGDAARQFYIYRIIDSNFVQIDD